jgi:hypothetical protein
MPPIFPTVVETAPPTFKLFAAENIPFEKVATPIVLDVLNPPLAL